MENKKYMISHHKRVGGIAMEKIETLEKAGKIPISFTLENGTDYRVKLKEW